MNTRTSYVAIAIIATVLATSTSAVFAQGYYDEEAFPSCPDPASEMKREQAAQLDIPIRVWTDKAVYDHKSTITIEGSVANVRLGTEIGLTVIGPSPFNNIVAVDQLKIGSDGKYKTTLSTAGDSWKYDGTYTIKVTYGSQQINNKALVQLTGASVIGFECAPGELTARVGASNYCIPYSISGATVTGARINQATTSMTININTSSDGMLKLEIPRNVLDTKSSTDPLFVLVDGEEVDSEESVTAVILDTPVTLQVFHEGNLVDIAQITVAQDGKFTHTMLAKGPLWQKDGKYIVRASYGANYMVETNFEYNTKLSVIETTDIFEVDAGSYGTFDVNYTVRGATVKNMIVDPEIFALIAIVETEDDGSITLDLPRESIDAKKNDSTDDSFIILIDGVEVPYNEIATDVDSRTITIEFEEGDSDIEIIGTFVVPEFGSIAALILIVGIVSIILLSSKYRIPVTKAY